MHVLTHVDTTCTCAHAVHTCVHPSYIDMCACTHSHAGRAQACVHMCTCAHVRTHVGTCRHTRARTHTGGRVVRRPVRAAACLSRLSCAAADESLASRASALSTVSRARPLPRGSTARLNSKPLEGQARTRASLEAVSSLPCRRPPAQAGELPLGVCRADVSLSGKAQQTLACPAAPLQTANPEL